MPKSNAKKKDVKEDVKNEVIEDIKDKAKKTKEEVEEKLSAEYGIDEPGAVDDEALDDIDLGPANPIIRRHVLWALGAGIIPVPILDFAALTVVQVKMVEKLSKHYNVKFSRDKVKSIVISLIGSLAAQGLQGSVLTRLFRRIPVVGAIGFIATSTYNAAVTYAVGKLFVVHFDSGGTLLDFDHQSKETKRRFNKFVKDGKQVVETLKS